MSAHAVAVLLALSPPDEQAMEELLYGTERVNIVAGGASTGELINLASTHPADAVLLSHDLRGLDAGAVSRLRAKGLRTVGVAIGDAEAALLAEFDVDAIVRPSLALAEFVDQLREPLDNRSQEPQNGSVGARSARLVGKNANVLAVVGSKGAPGASELALSLGASVAQRWPALLVEMDGDGGGLSVRLDVDRQEGSLLGLARALRRNDPELHELLGRWIVAGKRGWPNVLLGVPDPQRNLAEIFSPGIVSALLNVLAEQFALVVCDVGHRLARGSEADAAVRLHRDVVVSADAVILVLGQRQQQLQSGFRQLELLLDELSVPAERIRLVVNAQDGQSADAETVGAIAHELDKRGVAVDAWLPWDRRALRASVRLGLPLAIARPRGRYARTLQRLIDSLIVAPVAEPKISTTPPKPSQVKPAVSAARREVALPWRR
jgi:Flp pilus assembly CpaE family ATPase